MKKSTKVISVIIAVAMLLSMTAILSSAAGQNNQTNDGKITLTNPTAGQTYNLYQILNLVSYDDTLGAYLYTAVDPWNNFVANEGKDWLEVKRINEVDFIIWKGDQDAANVKAFAKAAMAYAAANNIAAVAAPTSAEGALVWANLPLGYYLMDSSVGTLCSLVTTDKEVTITEKNSINDDKVIHEDSDVEDAYGKNATYQIGDKVPFKITVNAQEGADGLIVHDSMSKGLTLDVTSFEVWAGETRLSSYGDDQAYTVIDSNLGTCNGTACTFHVVFEQSYLDTLTSQTDITILYKAELNKDAEIAPTANTNDSCLEYGDENFSEWKKTTVYTYYFDMVKTDSSNKLLAGAKFELYDAETAGNMIPLIKESENVYRVADLTERNAEGFVSAEIVTNTAGAIQIKGLDSDKDTIYWLEETEAPTGYNKLPARVKVVKDSSANLEATIAEGVWTSGGVHVINETGSKLPETGGMGTTMFILFGSMTALAAAVVLVARKKAAGYR